MCFSSLLLSGQRSYAKQTVYDAHLKSKNHIKKAAALEAKGSNPDSANGQGANGAPHASTSTSTLLAANEKARSMALAEFQIRYFVSDYDSPLLVIRNDTKSNVERKQALTDKERQIENEELEERERREAEEAAQRADRAARKNFRTDEDDAFNNEDDEEERIYNPLKLPLGWDGKPIPFWLYKLHGLGVEYTCEICSNFAYRGRKNFERHFQEARHAFGQIWQSLQDFKATYPAERGASKNNPARVSLFSLERCYSWSSPETPISYLVLAYLGLQSSGCARCKSY